MPLPAVPLEPNGLVGAAGGVESTQAYRGRAALASVTGPLGSIASKPGPLLASVDTWTIKVKGRGGHASMPHLAVDPVPVACEIGLAFYAMVTRRTNVFDPVVLTLGKIAGGTASNVIPETVEVLGTLRTTSEAARETAHEGIRRVATNIAVAHSCEAAVGIKRGYPVRVNAKERQYEVIRAWLDTGRDREADLHMAVGDRLVSPPERSFPERTDEASTGAKVIAD